MEMSSAFVYGAGFARGISRVGVQISMQDNKSLCLAAFDDLSQPGNRQTAFELL